MQTGWQLESSIRQIGCSNFLQCVCRGGSQLPVTATKKWKGCLFKQQCELEIKLGERRCFVDFLAKLSFNMQLLEYRFRWSNSSSHFSCSYLPLICLSTNQNIQLIHSLLIRIEWTTGNGIVKLREREGQRVDLGRSLKGHLWMVDGGWWYTFAWCFTLNLVSHLPTTRKSIFSDVYGWNGSGKVGRDNGRYIGPKWVMLLCLDGSHRWWRMARTI